MAEVADEDALIARFENRLDQLRAQYETTAKRKSDKLEEYSAKLSPIVEHFKAKTGEEISPEEALDRVVKTFPDLQELDSLRKRADEYRDKKALVVKSLKKTTGKDITDSPIDVLVNYSEELSKKLAAAETDLIANKAAVKALIDENTRLSPLVEEYSTRNKELEEAVQIYKKAAFDAEQKFLAEHGVTTIRDENE